MCDSRQPDEGADSTPEGGCTLCATASSVSVDAAYAFGDWPPGHAEAFGDEHDPTCPLCGVDAQSAKPESGHEHTIDGWIDDGGAWHFKCSDDDCAESVVRP